MAIESLNVAIESLNVAIESLNVVIESLNVSFKQCRLLKTLKINMYNELHVIEFSSYFRSLSA